MSYPELAWDYSFWYLLKTVFSSVAAIQYGRKKSYTILPNLIYLLHCCCGALSYPVRLGI